MSRFKGPFSGLIFYAKDLITKRGNTSRLVTQLEASQWWSRESLACLQTDKLKRLLVHCYETVPFYRDLFKKCGLKPKDIQTLDDLGRLPVLTKTELRDQAEQFYSEDPKQQSDATVVRTSGSTGERLMFKLGPSTIGYHLANAVRGRGWWGIRVGDGEMKFWGVSTAFENDLKGKIVSRIKRFKDSLLSVSHVSPFNMTDDVLASYAALLLKRKPELIFGYGGAIYLFARYIEQHQCDLKGYKPQAIIYTSETVYPSQKELIERVFGAPLVCEYGSVECGIMAYECEKGRLHLMDETLYVEQLEDGALVVTHLENYTFPLIRYKIGDLGHLSSDGCDCGRGLTVLEALSGRANDVIIRPNGDAVHPELFDYIMRYQRDIRRFRVVEKDIGCLEVLLETGGMLPSEQIESLQEAFASHLGTDFDVSFVQVDNIPNDPSGKFRWVIGRA